MLCRKFISSSHSSVPYEIHCQPLRGATAEPWTLREQSGHRTKDEMTPIELLTGRQPLKEWQNVPALELTANDYITCRVNSVDLKNRLGDIETDCRDRLHVWLLRIVGALPAPASMALPCRCRIRPQHQNLHCPPLHSPLRPQQ